MGCVATTARFFGNGKLGRRRWKEALTEVSAELQQFSAGYRAHGWQETIGSSGTIKAIGNILAGMKLTRGAITDVGLRKLRDALLEFDDIDAIKLPGLSDDRKPVIAGGVLVLEAAFNELAIARMQVAETAMREGVLYDMVGRAQDRDPREASIEALSTRYGVDVQQAQRVKATALALFDQAARGWDLDDEARLLLRWAARLHEIGLSIAHSQYHHHSAYVAEHSDIAGFATQEQQAIAGMLRCQRRSLSLHCFEKLPERMRQSTLRLTLLLRLAVLLHRSRSHDPRPPPPPRLQPLGSGYVLSIAPDWLDAHALTREDLDAEVDYLRDVGLELRLSAGDE
jgi:exopolyphosphatase/guanosine-5'-triphosphate,3'-diphosphate pyrophosphatase